MFTDVRFSTTQDKVGKDKVENCNVKHFGIELHHVPVIRYIHVLKLLTEKFPREL